MLKNEREENKIIHQAGGQGQITISTNMSGRGTDIVIGEQVSGKRRPGGADYI